MTTKKTPAGALTPAQLEKRLTAAFKWAQHHYTPENVAAARETFRARRAVYGLTSAGTLLSEDIAKTQKNDVRTYALALLPHTVSGAANVCAFEDRCAATCVAFSGNGGYASTQDARMARTRLMTDDPRAFALLLIDELLRVNDTARDAYWRAHRLAGTRPNNANPEPLALVRMNAYSDIRWERVAPFLFTDNRWVGFYDYTKHPLRSRPADTLPRNYRLTYSVSTRSTVDEVFAQAKAGRNPAAVFAARAHSNNDTLPATWCGLPVIDGDKTDDRYNDPRAVVVGLRRKGSLLAGGDLVEASTRLARKAARLDGLDAALLVASEAGRKGGAR